MALKRDTMKVGFEIKHETRIKTNYGTYIWYYLFETALEPYLVGFVSELNQDPDLSFAKQIRNQENMILN